MEFERNEMGMRRLCLPRVRVYLCPYLSVRLLFANVTPANIINSYNRIRNVCGAFFLSKRCVRFSSVKGETFNIVNAGVYCILSSRRVLLLTLYECVGTLLYYYNNNADA